MLIHYHFQYHCHLRNFFHLPLQLIIFMALANGRSRILCEEPSLHTRTAMVIAESLLPGLKFSVSKAQGSQQLYVIECEGAAVAAR